MGAPRRILWGLLRGGCQGQWEKGGPWCDDARAPNSMPSGRKLTWGIPESRPNNIACVHAKLLQSCPTLCDPWTVAHQALLSMGFSRQGYWSGLPFPPSRESFRPRDRFCVSCVSCIGRWILYHLGSPLGHVKYIPTTVSSFSFRNITLVPKADLTIGIFSHYWLKT